MDAREKTLAQLMFILGTEFKYSSKLYHYIENEGLEPIECQAHEIDLSSLNKYEFGLLKQVRFDDLETRVLIETEKIKR